MLLVVVVDTALVVPYVTLTRWIRYRGFIKISNVLSDNFIQVFKVVSKN